jgi:hypothetical protein
MDGIIELSDLSANERADVVRIAKIKGIDLGKKVTPAEKKVLEEQQKTDKEFEGVVGLMDKLKKQAEEVGVLQVATGFLPDSKLSQFNSTKGLIAQKIGKMFEGGKLSDADREFYQKTILKISPIGLQSGKRQAIDNITQNLSIAMGADPARLSLDVKGDSKVVMFSPDGKTYKVDKSEVEEAQNNGWRLQ